jgi:acetyl esterase/lipase
MKKCNFITLLIVFIASHNCFAQEQIEYKNIDTTRLYMQIYQPEKMDKTQKKPAMVFFFGGGWKKGSVKQFEPHAKYFAKRGMVCFLVDYRVESRHNFTIFESVQDAKSAIRYIREHADLYNVDTLKIVASGGSAGGHLAAAAAIIEEYNEVTDSMLISCKPNALVLFNPAIDNGPAGVGYDRVKDAYKNISPIHNIKKGAPPTIIMLGTKDDLIPVETAKYYQTVMNKVGSRCDLILYEGKGHGFFNYDKFDNYKITIADADIFLQSVGYLTEYPKVAID